MSKQLSIKCPHFSCIINGLQLVCTVSVLHNFLFERIKMRINLMNAILVASNNLNLKLWGGIPNNTVIERNLGNRNICLYFDFRPITYVAPPLYTIVVMLAAGKINFSDMDKLLLRN